MNKLYVIPVVILVLAVPAYLFLFDEGYCPEIEEMEESNIQIIGDSVFGSGAEGCTDISGFMSLALDLRVIDNAVPGSTIIGDEEIPSQYVSKKWDWTIIDGGGNDIMGICAEEDCDETLDTIITDDNKGLMPDLINKAKQDESKVILIGYYSVPKGSEFEVVVLEIEILNDRYEEFAAVNDNVYFISLKDVMDPESTPEYYSDDLVHPSEEGHRVIGEHLADFITAN
tara:strand:- start:7 stop:690 length:684 start_codon:yes stop_codon:yes gene_type:complete